MKPGDRSRTVRALTLVFLTAHTLDPIADSMEKASIVQQAELFLSKLEERAHRLMELADRIERQADTNNITAYLPFREEVENFRALSILITDRLGAMTSARKDELEMQFHKLQVLMLKLVIRTSLKFFFVMSAKSLLPLGAREMFELELKTLHDAETMLSDPRFESDLDEEARDNLTLTKNILQEIIDHAPSLLDFSAKPISAPA